jgi:HEAT repeat protein
MSSIVRAACSEERLVNIKYGVCYKRDGRVRAAAARAFGVARAPRAVPALIKARVRRAAAEALGTLFDTKGAPSLIDALCDPVYNVRIAAAMSLGELGDFQAVEPLKKLQSDIILPVRTAALIACIN